MFIFATIRFLVRPSLPIFLGQHSSAAAASSPACSRLPPQTAFRCTNPTAAVQRKERRSNLPKISNSNIYAQSQSGNIPANMHHMKLSQDMYHKMLWIQGFREISTMQIIIEYRLLGIFRDQYIDHTAIQKSVTQLILFSSDG